MHVVARKRLRVLILDEELPWPPNSGKRIRTWNLLRRLSGRHDLHWITYSPASDEAQAIFAQYGITVTALQPLPPSKGAGLYGRLLKNVFSRYPYSVAKHFSSRLQRRVLEACKSNRFDLVHFEWTPYARCKTVGVPRLIVAHNIESDIWRRRAEHDATVIGRWFFGIQARRMATFERAAARDADHIVAVSELDAATFRSYGVTNISVVPNGVDLDYFQPTWKFSGECSLLFVGSLDWYPNIDAIREFVKHVLPLIRERNPRITLRVIGRRPGRQLATDLQEIKGVEFVGEVTDVRPHLADACAVVVPLRVGGGTRIKILEALAMAKPVISTSIGIEGLALTDQNHFLLANTPEEFAARIDALLTNPEEQLRLGRNGRALVEKVYGWDAGAEKLERAWISAAARSHVTASCPALAATGAIQ